MLSIVGCSGGLSDGTANGAFGKASQSKPIKVLSFNIRAGRTPIGNVDVQPIIDVIKSVSPDFVLLQEVDVNTHRSGNIDIASSIAQATNMNVHFAEAMKYDNGAYGNAVLSKLRIIDSGAIPLPQGREPRSVAWAKTSNLSVYSAHFDAWDVKAQVESSNVVISRIESSGSPAILAGDFNALPDSDVVGHEDFETTYKHYVKVASLILETQDGKFDYSVADDEFWGTLG